MLQQKPPIKIIAPGRCFRRDEVDATHGMFFTQLEALVVDEGVTLGDLKGTMEFFFRELFGEGTRVRFRPHFFPFTEPSFEVDMSVPHLRIKGKEWIEIGGCGMVDPAVFQAVGIDPTRYTGFAFGMGLERMVMLIHGIPDLRLLSENDIRFLRQF
jgi:phenylalanyl-tRNA synthetase alpha chain